jgi:hypothetical protein
LDEAPLEAVPFGSILEDNLDCKNDLGFVLLVDDGFEFVLVPPLV